jgi:glycosyltransferase involved in cell wall biosynthesis
LKILINTPSIKESRGGVANHFKGLKNYWKLDVSYNIIGGRNGIHGIVILPYDLIKFLVKCIVNNPNIIVLNPSLGRTALKRDALFLKIAKVFNKKVIVFFHGWNKSEEKYISKNPKWFLKNYNTAQLILVLASEFKSKLQEWGVNKPIQLTSTKVDNDLLSNFKIENKKYKQNILFLARIEEAKGIFITIDAFLLIKKKFPEAKLTIAGDGNALLKAKEIVKDKDIQDVNFTGKISGDRLKSVFSNSSIYILPTSHGEGMPTSILEAMAFGLAVITRPTGGLIDFFENGKMGYMIQSINYKDFAEKIRDILEHPVSLKKTGKYNNQFAKENFMASQVASDLECIFLKYDINK